MMRKVTVITHVTSATRSSVAPVGYCYLGPLQQHRHLLPHVDVPRNPHDTSPTHTQRSVPNNSLSRTALRADARRDTRGLSRRDVTSMGCDARAVLWVTNRGTVHRWCRLLTDSTSGSCTGRSLCHHGTVAMSVCPHDTSLPDSVCPHVWQYLQFI
jgi:hypothetical protein